ncbi:hypothetical protein Ancab_028801 [Ancistrocladus abbreviatus]
MISVPFKWEKQPGISKVAADSEDHDHDSIHSRDQRPVSGITLTSPPCQRLEKAKFPTVAVVVDGGNGMQIPPPPRTFQPPFRSCSSRRFGKKEKDPFLAAYMVCTKTSVATVTAGELHGYRRLVDLRVHGLRKSLHSLSCKSSCIVRDDALMVRAKRYEE